MLLSLAANSFSKTRCRWKTLISDLLPDLPKVFRNEVIRPKVSDEFFDFDREFSFQTIDG